MSGIAGDRDWSRNRYSEWLLQQKEKLDMAAKKRPPLAWNNGMKPLTFQWGLFLKGKRIDNVVSYNVETGEYVVDIPKAGLKTYTGPILVKRLS